MQPARELADLVDRERRAAPRARSSRSRAAPAAVREARDRDPQRLQRDDEPLLGSVVEIALEPPPLRVARLHESLVGGAELALRLPQLRRVADDRDDLVVVDRHDACLELTLVTARSS